MDIIRLYQDYGVNYKTEGHKHCRPGWVNTECPFCTGNPGYHLGYNLKGNFFTCWRCGWHPVIPTIAKLIGTSVQEAKRIVSSYGMYIPKNEKIELIEQRNEHKLPSGAGPLSRQHKKYLEKRGFDPDKLEREWNLLGTGPVSKLDNSDYKHRIIIPYIWKRQQVSFQSRDITGKSPAKYKACPTNRELIHHKHILYGDERLWGMEGICVEGPIDVWKLGKKAFAVSGIKYTRYQLLEISRRFKRVFVVFDNESQAISQAEKLAGDLRFLGVETIRIQVDDDPGNMNLDDAEHFVRQLLSRRYKITIKKY